MTLLLPVPNPNVKSTQIIPGCEPSPPTSQTSPLDGRVLIPSVRRPRDPPYPPTKSLLGVYPLTFITLIYHVYQGPLRVVSNKVIERKHQLRDSGDFLYFTCKYQFRKDEFSSPDLPYWKLFHKLLNGYLLSLFGHVGPPILLTENVVRWTQVKDRDDGQLTLCTPFNELGGLGG